jgi:sec-independent protein translocase protein TatA
MGFVNIGPLELLVLGIIALLVLGPKRLPEAARSLGKGVREMRNALQDKDDDVYVPEPREPASPDS